jgi:MFS family permease
VGTSTRPGLWDPERRALTTGLVLTITFIASEALAVVTVMPVVARDLGGLSLYGWVFSAFMLGSLVGIVVAGRDADRHGPARPYLAGLLLFASGLVVAGLAPTMAVLVVGRALQGLGAGAVPAVAYVAIGRSLPEILRPRMMAVLSTAWVVPGIVGPALAAAVAHQFGWRWVFLGLVPFVAVVGSLALPALFHLGRPERHTAAEHRVTDGIRTAAGAALLLAALDVRQLWEGVALGLAGVVVGLPALRRLLPAGTLVARPGLPTTILVRGMLTFAFFGSDAYVTLSITTVRHHSVLLAGAVVTSSTLAWTAGAWVQAHLNDRWEGGRLVRCGQTGILIGIAGHGHLPPCRGASGGGLRIVDGLGLRDGAVLRPHLPHDVAGCALGAGRVGLGLPQSGRRAGHGAGRRSRRRRRGVGLPRRPSGVERGGAGLRHRRLRRRGRGRPLAPSAPHRGGGDQGVMEPRRPDSHSSAACQAASAWRRTAAPWAPAAG